MDARQRSREWRRDNPERYAAYLRKHRYGLTDDAYNALLEAQGRRCAICLSEDSGKRGWSVDHDHTTGAVRGLLCGRCNTGLGLFNDDPERLYAAIEYLNKEKYGRQAA